MFIEYLFEADTVGPILSHLTAVLAMSAMRECKCVVLVGGLANSRYFQQRVCNAFGTRMAVLVPSKATLCVVSGAARCGLLPRHIQQRVLPKTYGIRIDYAKEALPEKYKRGLAAAFVRANSFRCKQSRKEYVKNIFSVFVRKGDCVRANERAVLETYYRRHDRQKTIDIKICASTESEPLHVLEAGAEELGELRLLFPENDAAMAIDVEFHFNDTTLRVFAYPKGAREARKEYIVNYL